MAALGGLIAEKLLGAYIMDALVAAGLGGAAASSMGNSSGSESFLESIANSITAPLRRGGGHGGSDMAPVPQQMNDVPASSVTGRPYDTTAEIGPPPGMQANGEQKYQQVSDWPRSIPGRAGNVSLPPLYRDENGFLRHLNRAAERTAYVRALAGDATMVRIRNDLGASESAIYTPESFADEMQRAGIRLRALNYVRGRVVSRYGSTENAYIIFRRWVQKSLKPKVKMAVAGAIVAQGVSAASSAIFRDAKGGKYDMTPEYDDPELTDEELDKQLADIAGETWDTNNQESYEFAPLPGSVAGTPDPDSFMGPEDSYWPRSSPAYDLPMPPRMKRSPGDGIFSEGLQGDWLSERGGMDSARVLKTSIPVPIHVDNIHPDQYYSNRSHSAPLPVPPRPQKKPRVIPPTHADRSTEELSTQNYDPRFVPALPSNLTSSTAVHWREYTSDNRGVNVPLTDAPNIVGMGYDAETVERQMAEATTGKEVPQTVAPDQNAPLKVSAGPPAAEPHTQEVNTANQTNPAYQNAQKQKPESSGDKPVTRYHV